MTTAPRPAIEPGTFVKSSRYAREVLQRWQLAPDWLESEAPADDPGLALEPRLRRRRQLEALRIQWLEILGRHDVETTGRQLSTLAVECLEQALAEAEAGVAERHGHLRDEHGQSIRLAVLALGKLGGDELNFNSDLDLVFCHTANGESDGRRALESREYFGRVIRELSRIMEQVTRDGRVWVIDTRLRPFGQSGALVWSLEAMEQYFLSEGRTWERYAWLKARPVAGDLRAGRLLLERIQPFVYRRYLDYGLFESLRGLHVDIERRSRRDELQDDIKRGPGGIRELEFLVQSLQLLRGGREPGLRTSGFLPALRAARDARLLSEEEADAIDSDYRYLRTLENRLQLATGRQTHALPDQPDLQNHLATLMGHEGAWASLADEIASVRTRVRTLFHARFEAPQREPAAAAALWPPDENTIERLDAAGFEDADEAARALERLHERLSRRPLSAEARQRLDRLMPELLEEVLQHDPPDTGLIDLLALIETIAQRSAYLALLHERPVTLARCVRVFRTSARVAGWIVQSPQLLDDLLAPDQHPELPRLPTLQPDDDEHNLNALARFRQTGFVRIALGQMDGTLDPSEARVRLTRLAEQVLTRMADLFMGQDTRPAIIGYGNLGAGELHYSSDLDLVFLHSGEVDSLRPVQRLINAMQLPLAGGRLYEIDTRLRPNGGAGMLVSSFDSFADYQARHAWIWEHQALIRARCVVGDESAAARFETIRRDVLMQARDADTIRSELEQMRERQRAERKETADRRLLGDLQFIAECGILIHASRHPALADCRATLAQIEGLQQHGVIDSDAARDLSALHREAIALRDRRFLERGIEIELPAALHERLARRWNQCFGGSAQQILVE